MNLHRRAFVVLLVALPIVGCASNSQHASIMPGVELASYGNFLVVQEAEDTRGVGQVIADDLLSRDLSASVGAESDGDELTDVLVFYDTKWHWDMTPYLPAQKIKACPPA